MAELTAPDDEPRRQVVLVTGCSSGFGEVIAKTLAKAGHTVYATIREIDGRNVAAAQALRAWATDHGASLRVVEMDVASDESVDVAVASILRVQPIDAVVNNAGISATGPLEAFDSAQWRELFNVNAFGPLRVNRAVLPAMRQRRSGLLLHISSTLGRVLPGLGGLYPASKWALEGLVESLHYEVKPFGVDAVILEPGSFPTLSVARGMLPADSNVAAVYARESRFTGFAKPGPDYVPPDLRDVGDAVLRLIELPEGERPLRTVVGPIFTEGVAAFNETYELVKARLAESLKRPDQAITWAKGQEAMDAR